MSKDATSLLDPETISRLSSVTLQARKRMEGVLSGIHKSPHHGSSVEFLEHKRYTPGDDIRNIDWKLVARSDRLYIKQYEDETNLRAVITVDSSASMAYGPEGVTKIRFCQLMGAALAYLLLSQSDAVGLLSQSGEDRLYVPPRSAWSHYRAIAEALDELECKGQEAWIRHMVQLVGQSSGARTGGNAFPKHGMFIVLSDLLSDREETIQALQLLRDRGHDVILFHVLHPWELNFPFDAPRIFRSPQSAEREIMADPETVREAYLQRLNELQDFYRRELRRIDVDYVPLSSDESLQEGLIKYLRIREAHQNR